MLRSFVQFVLGRRKSSTSDSADEPPPSSPQWRQSPTRTWSEEVGNGLVATMSMATGHHGFVGLVGESHYRATLARLASILGPEGVFTARLVPEPHNQFDSHAIAVHEVTHGLGVIGYLPRDMARSYQPKLISHATPVACPARLTGRGPAHGVVLDFEPVREALGLPRVSIDRGDTDYEALSQYHKVKEDTRQLVKDTRPLERSAPAEAVARYRRAIECLGELEHLARTARLGDDFVFAQTDALPLERIVMCLVKFGETTAATDEIARFVQRFPHTREMTLVRAATERVERANKRNV
jgi:hypothetical protein